MDLLNNKIYKSIIIVLWLLLFGNVLSVYKDLKILEIPATRLDFDIALLEVGSEKERGVFYYDTGKGFNKYEVKVFPYSQPLGENYKHYSVLLTTNKKIKRLRFDPLDKAGKIIIKNLEVRKYSTQKVSFSKIAIDSHGKNAIGTMEVKSDSITINAIGNDPHFVLVDNFSSYQKK